MPNCTFKMKLNQTRLIDDLRAITAENIKSATDLMAVPIDLLNKKSSSQSWSTLECVEHLNLYSDFYLPELTKAINNSKPEFNEVFISGWLGNYFANSMLPKAQLNKMKTFKDKNPNGRKLTMEVLHTFIYEQNTLLSLLDKCRNINLTKIKTSISITSWIKLRLGDTLRVVIYHNQRHIAQAHRAITQ